MSKAALALIACAVLATTSVLAQPREHGGAARPFMEKRQAMLDELKLSAEQKTQMAKLGLDFEKRQTETQSKIRIARLDLKGLFMAEKPDRAAIEKQLKTISELQYQAKLNHVDHLFAVRGILTPDQQKIWKENMMMPGDGMGGPPHPMRGRRQMMRDDDED
jgi:Spy/CpxP family protein refolding chaperone